MNKSKKYYFTPTPPSPPPKNTQVNIRCSHCSKYEVCRIREDYLKTAFLIEEILGHPSSQRELSSKCQDVLWGFKGFNFEKPEGIFLEEISIENIEEKASFEKAKYRDKDTVQMAYKIWDYILIFNAIWNEEKEEFYINNGREIQYGAVVIMEESSQDAIKEKLKTWRESYNEEKENDELDIINTTYFSSILNCDFYEWDKHTPQDKGFDRMFLKNKFGDYDCYQHLATYHIEENRVPLYRDKPVGFVPMPFPWPPYDCEKQKSKSLKRKEVGD